MKGQILKLAAIANAPTRTIIGLMSGTSLDGLDIALCQFEGTGYGTVCRLVDFITIPYTDAFRSRIKKIAFQPAADLCELTVLNAEIGTYTAELVLQALKNWNFPASEVDIVASHGQTIFHAPKSFHLQDSAPNATLQLGDADHIAVKTGIITLSDFRQKHIAAGGEGAPLVFYGDSLLFTHRQENRILLNIGGISNFTWLPAGNSDLSAFSTDVGPGNTMMDQYVSIQFPGKSFDQDAIIARSGSVNQQLLEALMTDPFFELELPRTTGPEYFNLKYLEDALQKCGNPICSPADIMATLCAFSAGTIVQTIRLLTGDIPYEVYVSGGGMHNPLLHQMISEGLNLDLHSTHELGLNPDAKEAVLFALLANECIAGQQQAFKSRPGIPAVTMGKISLPD
ncbi:anhydro-N-acetylmuramic acid kinase [Pedobacter antarcticus]|uniref:anhydro-N-acetylmuramic acid kinase n=1 Tax=Pedobacter antarcticus TaxID=34086 RepID=UPI0029303238|nr:anhydro-N-acetylmuramic acid kinase [Pedobacter antarcticus]